MTETLPTVALEDVLRAKMRQPGGLALDLTARRDHGRRNDNFAHADLAEGVVYTAETGPSGSQRFRRRYTGQSPALCAACGLHFGAEICVAMHGEDDWDGGVLNEPLAGRHTAFVHDAATNLEKGAREVIAYPRPA